MFSDLFITVIDQNPHHTRTPGTLIPQLVKFLPAGKERVLHSVRNVLIRLQDLSGSFIHGIHLGTHQLRKGIRIPAFCPSY
jgi:hypothetical protein